MYEFNEKHKTTDWNAYIIINDGKESLELALIIMQGCANEDITTHMHHKIELLPAKGYAKIEFMENGDLKLNNFFSVTYVLNNKMYERRGEFPANSIADDNAVDLVVMTKMGILAR